jgi:hypothetical protein
MRSLRTVVLLTAATALAASAVAAPTLASAARVRTAVAPQAAVAGYFTPLASPVRILDTRTTHSFGPGQTSPLYVGGSHAKAGLPTSGVSSVVFNLTVTQGTASSDHVTVFPTGSARPNVSSINFRKGWTGANLVTVKLGTNGEVSFYNYSGHVHLIVDLVGWYSSGGANATGEFQEAQPQRLVDTRPASIGPVAPRGTITQPLDYSGSTASGNHKAITPNPNIKAMVVNITVVNPGGTGYITAWNGVAARPNASALNFRYPNTVTNLAIVPVAPCPAKLCTDPDVAGLPSITLYNGSDVKVNVLIDAWGFYDDGGLPGRGLVYKPLASPIRIVDTRNSTGTTTLGSNTTRTVHAPGTVADAGTNLLVQNVTGIPSANTYLTLWRNGESRPVVNNADPRTGIISATLSYTGVGNANDFNIYNYAGSTDVLVDVAGSLEPGPGNTNVAAIQPDTAARAGSAAGSAAGSWSARTPAPVKR